MYKYRHSFYVLFAVCGFGIIIIVQYLATYNKIRHALTLIEDNTILTANRKSISGNAACSRTRRIKTLKTACQKLELGEDIGIKRRGRRILVDDVNKVLLCVEPKVGTTTWRTLLINNTLNKAKDAIWDVHGNLRELGLPYLSNFSSEEIEVKLQTHFKIMVVRHPYDRLESAWFGKFRASCELCDTYGTEMLQKYHPQLPKKVIAKGEVTNFEDFIRFIQDGHDNIHWRAPYHAACHPCTIQYDYIAKLETFNTDADYIVNKHLKGRFGDMSRNSHRHAERTEHFGRHLTFFRNLTRKQLDFLAERHKDDFDMFGYAFDRSSYMATCNDPSEESDCC